MFKLLLYPFIAALGGAVVLGSLGIKKEIPSKKLQWTMAVFILLGVICEAVGFFNFDKWRLALMLFVFGIILEVMAMFIAAVGLCSSLTPVVSEEMDRLNIDEQERRLLRRGIWKLFRRFHSGF